MDPMFSKQNFQRAYNRYTQLKTDLGSEVGHNAEFQTLARYLRSAQQYQMELQRSQQVGSQGFNNMNNFQNQNGPQQNPDGNQMGFSNNALNNGNNFNNDSNGNNSSSNINNNNNNSMMTNINNNMSNYPMNTQPQMQMQNPSPLPQQPDQPPVQQGGANMLLDANDNYLSKAQIGLFKSLLRGAPVPQELFGILNTQYQKVSGLDGSQQSNVSTPLPPPQSEPQMSMPSQPVQQRMPTQGSQVPSQVSTPVQSGFPPQQQPQPQQHRSTGSSNKFQANNLNNNTSNTASPVVVPSVSIPIAPTSSANTNIASVDPSQFSTTASSLNLPKPEPPVREDKIMQKYSKVKIVKVKDPTVAVDAYSIPVTNEKVSFDVLQKARIIAPGVFPEGIDIHGANQIRQATISLTMDEAIRQIENLLKSEDALLSESEKIELEIDLFALKNLEVQKKVRGRYLSFTWFQNSVLANTHPNFLAKMRNIEMSDAISSNSIYSQQQNSLKISKQHKNVVKVSNKLAKTQVVYQKRLSIADKLKRFSKSINNFHNNTEKEEQKRIERNAKQRLQALKANDEEAYIKLLDQAKDTRITHLLKQTNQFLTSLAESVKEQQKETKDLSLLAGHSINNEEEIKKQLGEEADNADLDYYNVAHRYKEIVSKQPSILVGGTLKEYQLKGLQWMVSLFNNHLNGILADEMGLGKTIQTISLITYLVEVKKVPGPYLVIVPLSTLTNWNLEFDKWAPSLKKITFKGSPNQRRALHHDIKTGNFQILLTTFEYILKDRPLLAKIKWVHMIIDEGHRMKNTKSKLSYTLTTYYHTDYRLILTGTPLQNNLPELWALLNFVLPKIFNSVKSFDEWFNTPFANTGSQDKMDLSEEETLLVIRRLHKVLRPFLLRRLKKDVEKDLPNKIEKVIKCKMSALQQRLYRYMLERRTLYAYDREQQAVYPLKGNNNPIMQLKKIVNHPFVYDEVEDTINPTHETDDLIWRTSGKFEVLDRILPKFKASGHRVLMFFQMTSIMTIMEDFLNLRGMKYLRLDGGTKSDDRTTLLKVFNAPNSEYFAFLLSTRAGGLGLNLQTADTVIIFDTDWNPHQDLQAQDRAHRIGQKNEVRILRLITQDSVEEMVLERAHEKLDIDGKVIQAGKFDNKSTAEEQEALLRQLIENDENKKGDDEDEELTPDELNDILARNEDEKALFKQIDLEMEKEWFEKNKANGTHLSRLYDMNDLPDFYKKEPPVKVAVTVDGARAKKKISYSDESMSEFEWSKANGLVEDDSLYDKNGVLRPRKKRGRKKINYSATIEEDDEDDEEDLQEDDEDFGEEEGFDDRIKKRRRSKAKKIIDSEDGENTPKSSSSSINGPGRRGRKPKGRPKGKGNSKDPALIPEEVIDLSPDQRASLQNALKEIFNIVNDYQEETGYPEHPYRFLSEIFKEKPSKRSYPDYYAIIQQPISLKEIKKKITGFGYYKIGQLMRDLTLMFANAKKYNQEGSAVYNDAIKLETLANECAAKLEAALGLPTSQIAPAEEISAPLKDEVIASKLEEASAASNLDEAPLESENIIDDFMGNITNEDNSAIGLFTDEFNNDGTFDL